jgi:hypothetical protein
MGIVNLKDRLVLLQNKDTRTEEQNERYGSEKLMSPFILNFSLVDILFNGDSKFCIDDNIDLDRYFIEEKKLLSSNLIEVPYLEKFGNKKDFLLSLSKIEMFQIKGRQLLPNKDSQGNLCLSEGSVFFLINTKRLVNVKLNDDIQEKLDDKSMLENGIISDMIALDFVFESGIYTISIFKEEWIKWKNTHIR